MVHDNPKKMYEEYCSLVWAMIYKGGIRRQEQEDIFMETWKAIFSSLDSFDGRAKLSTWIARIARYKIIDHIRDHRLLPLEECELNRFIDGVEQKGVHAPVTTRSGGEPRDKAMQSELAEIVRDALEDLSPETRFIVRKWMLGLKYREIAELLNSVSDTPVDTNYIGKQLFLAKTKLRKSLSGKGIKDFQNLLE